MNKNLKNYHYKRINKDLESELLQTRKQSLSKILTKNVAREIKEKSNVTYLIINNETLLGFFTIKKSRLVNIKKERFNALKIVCIYIYKQYRNKGIGTKVLRDIQLSLRHDSKKKYEYILVNSYVDVVMFFISKGFDFYKNNRNLDYHKKNVIILYKKVS